jgi:Fic family protein
LLQKASAIPDPFEQAFLVMVQLPYLQPFEDVNKRVSHLGANIPLIQNNLCPPLLYQRARMDRMAFSVNLQEVICS